jgi:hypothetical protein
LDESKKTRKPLAAKKTKNIFSRGHLGESKREREKEKERERERERDGGREREMKTFIILIWATLWLIDILSQFNVRLARSGHKK